ncbi:hypothetical protein BDK51DRAFT_33141 [Blyttiomyces helicus]|uniref:Uncharacterized protein n=1 Tax=Blyttiomyces helicus TaxID=388810 RepID=A0A4P9W984_9FUNG|nr:hypothetical protein BDK51DRAFT_33141 [Blyttiomyces helicus]|eukprot:RKO89111.1 hypothetical protein BDK51DRAFT_33141 [Blyttiomyces helicus]
MNLFPCQRAIFLKKLISPGKTIKWLVKDVEDFLCPHYKVWPFPNRRKILEQLQKQTKNKAPNCNALAGPLHLAEVQAQATAPGAIPANPAMKSGPPGLPQHANGSAGIHPIILELVLDNHNEKGQGAGYKYRNHNHNYNHNQNIQDKINPPSSSDKPFTDAEMSVEVYHGTTEAPALSDHTKHLLKEPQVLPPGKRHQPDTANSPIHWTPFAQADHSKCLRTKETIKPEQSELTAVIQAKPMPKCQPRTQAANRANANVENFTQVRRGGTRSQAQTAPGQETPSRPLQGQQASHRGGSQP